MATKTKYKDLLDYTVSYRAVWTILAVVFALGIAGLIAWGRLKPPSEEMTARQDVKSAERLLQRALGCGQVEGLKPDQQALLADGRDRVSAATSALTLKKFNEARTSSRLAQDSLKQFVDKVCAPKESVAEFVRIQGDVKVKKVQSPRWVPARKGSLAVGDRIWAVDGMAQIAYKLSGDIQEIRPGTIIEIKDVIEAADGTPGTVTDLQHGEMIGIAPAGSPSRINAPHDTTIEYGGDRVGVESAEGSESVRTTSYRGGARVKHGAESRTLERGTYVEAKPTGLGAPKPALGPPELKEPIDGRVFSTEKAEDKVILFKWQPMDNATGYVWQIARNDVFTPVINAGDDERFREPTAALNAPPPNTYFWRVAGVDKEGVRGDWSEVRKFSVRGMPVGGQGPGHKPPEITIVNKVEFGDRVIISGKTSQYVTLEVMLNGKKYTDVTVDDKGEFQQLVTLSQEGKNVIEFVAHDAYGQETREKVIAHFTL